MAAYSARHDVFHFQCQKYEHIEAKSVLVSINSNRTFEEILEEHHPGYSLSKNFTIRLECVPSMDGPWLTIVSGRYFPYTGVHCRTDYIQLF